MTPYYDHDGVTIYNGDALEVLPSLGRSVADAVVTDPPYIIGAVSAGSLSSKSGGWADMMNSSMWFTAWYRAASDVLNHEGAIWTFCNWRTIPVVMRAALDAGLPVTSLAVWDKEWIGPGGSTGLRPRYEMCALLAQPGFAVPDRGVPDVWRHKVGSHKKHGHPAEKPTNVVRHVLRTHGLKPGDLVVDPFMGSGTTAVVARDMGLRFVGIEAEEQWCQVAAERLGQQTFDLTSGASA